MSIDTPRRQRRRRRRRRLLLLPPLSAIVASASTQLLMLILSLLLQPPTISADSAPSPAAEPTYDVSSNFMTKGERHSPSYTLQKSQVECLYAPFHSGNSATISVFVPSVSHAKVVLTAAVVFEGPIATLVDTSPRHAKGELGNALMEGMRGHWPAVQAVEAKRGGAKEGSDAEEVKVIKFDEVVDFEHVRGDTVGIDEEEEADDDDDDDEIGEIENPRERRKRERRERRASAWGRRRTERKKKRGNNSRKRNDSRKRSQGRSQKKERGSNGSRWTGALPNQKFNAAKERARALTDAQSRYEGEPYEQTFTVPVDGWYRFCVRPTPSLPTNAALTVEMDLRSSTDLGGIDEETGHVNTHQRRLEMTEDAELMLMLSDEAQGQEGIKDDDLFTTTRLIKSLTDMVHEIREAQQQHKHRLDHHKTLDGHSHEKLVWSAKVETMLYVGITAFQVYTVRNWFKGGQLLGR